MAEHPVCTKAFKLSNGYQMPAVGLGTWQGGFGTDDAKALESSIIHSLRSGYRLIDTAQYYGIEANVGRAIRDSGIPRSEIIVVTKFWGEWHHDPAAAFQKSLSNLGLEYVDVFLMHWPWATTPEGGTLEPHDSPTFVDTWKMMEPLVGERCKAIGVSNFSQKTLDELLANAMVIPVVNQVELHALNPCFKLVPYCQSKGIHVMSWSTMGAGTNNNLLTHELFKGIAKAHGCSPGVVSLSWAVQRGITVIPKSSSKTRIEDNIRLVTLTEEEMSRIATAQDVIGRFRIADGIEAMHRNFNGRRTLQGWTSVDLGWEDEQGNWLL